MYMCTRLRRHTLVSVLDLEQNYLVIAELSKPWQFVLAHQSHTLPGSITDAPTLGAPVILMCNLYERYQMNI